MKAKTILLLLPLLFLTLTAGECRKLIDAEKAQGPVTPTEPPPVVLEPCVAQMESPLYLGGLVVQFFDRSANCGQREWQFGDGQVSGVQDPIHTYAECGQYTATLIAWAVVDQPDDQQVLVDLACPDDEG